LGDRFGGKGFPAIDLARVDLASPGNAQSSMAAVSADGSTVCDAPRELIILQVGGDSRSPFVAPTAQSTTSIRA
jgi:hypothetical protein